MAAPSCINLIRSRWALNSLLRQTINRVLPTYAIRISQRYVTSGAGTPQKPKRPLGKYMIFSQEKHPQVRAKNPDLSFAETAKEIARLWRELPDEERESYTAQAKQYMENYNEEIAVFKASLTEEDVKMIAQQKQHQKLMNVNKKNRQLRVSKSTTAAIVHTSTHGPSGIKPYLLSDMCTLWIRKREFGIRTVQFFLQYIPQEQEVHQYTLKDAAGFFSKKCKR